MAWTDPRTWLNGEIPTQTIFNTDHRDNLRELWHEVAYTEFTADVSSTTATELAPLDVVSAGAITFVANPIIVEFFSPGVTLQNSSCNLWDATTDLGRLLMTVSGGYTDAPVFVRRRLTPTAASHTYKVRLWTTGGGTTRCRAGAGGAGVLMPGFIRILQKGGA